MSISTLDSLDSVRLLKAIDELTDRQIKAEISSIKDFQKACNAGDANALAPFAPMTTDWSLAKPPVIAGQPLPKRAQTLSEVMVEALDYGSGPSMTEAMQLVLNAANGMAVQGQAQALVARMASTWAKFNSEVES